MVVYLVVKKVVKMVETMDKHMVVDLVVEKVVKMAETMAA
jgi:hypothetical protein